MYEISKQFMFSAAHSLEHLPSTHPCTRLHGHDYHVTITLRGENLNEAGFIRDYRDLSEFKQWLDDLFDHRYLNERLPIGMNPSAENIAKFIFDVWRDKYPELYSIEVKETPKTSAKYFEL